MLAVLADFEPWFARVAETMDQCRQRAVALATEFHWLSIAQQPRPAAHRPIPAVRLEPLQFPRRLPLDVFLPEHLFEFGAADFASQPVHLVIGNRAKFTLEFF